MERLNVGDSIEVVTFFRDGHEEHTEGIVTNKGGDPSDIRCSHCREFRDSVCTSNNASILGVNFIGSGHEFNICFGFVVSPESRISILKRLWRPRSNIVVNKIGEV